MINYKTFCYQHTPEDRKTFLEACAVWWDSEGTDFEAATTKRRIERDMAKRHAIKQGRARRAKQEETDTARPGHKSWWE